jgi:phage I-like protein
MPWNIEKRNDEYCIIKKGESSPIDGGCHANRSDAVKHLRALYANDKKMSDIANILSFDEFARDTDDPNVKLVQAFRWGKWDHPIYGEVEITPETAQQMVDNYQKAVYDQELPYYYEHGLDAAKGGRAAGWVRDIVITEEGVFDKVEFTDAALAEIEGGEWKYISPEYREVWIDSESGEVFENVRVAGSLTNQPFFKGMAPLNFSELFGEPKNTPKEEEGGTQVDELLLKFAEALGVKLAEDASEEDVLAEAKKLNDTIEPLRKAKEEGEKTQTFREQFPDEYERMQTLMQAQEESDARRFAESYARFTERDKEGNATGKADRGFSTLVQDKIVDLHRKMSAKAALASDVREVLDAIANDGIVDYKEHGSSRGTEDFVPKSTDPRMAFSEAVEDIMKKDDMEYEAAIRVAAEKHPDLYAEYLGRIPATTK